MQLSTENHDSRDKSSVRKSPSKRGSFRYELRTLLLFVTAVGIFAAWVFAGWTDVVVLNGPFPPDQDIKVPEQTDHVRQIIVSVSKFGPRGLVSVQFTFQGKPGSYSPLNIQVLGYDARGEKILDQGKTCYDGRMLTAQQASPMGYQMIIGFELPMFDIPLETMSRLNKIELRFSKKR
jgi:hypothetical protein